MRVRLTFITLGLFLMIWGVAVLHAVLAVNSAKQDARAREVADAMRGRREGRAALARFWSSPKSDWPSCS